MAGMLAIDWAPPGDDGDDGHLGDEYKYVANLRITHTLNEMRRSGEFCDVTLTVNDKKFPAHKIVLVAFSPYFKAMFAGASNRTEFTIDDVEAWVLELVLDFAYTSEVVVTRQNVRSLFSAAHQLDVTALGEACGRYLEQHLDPSNCVGIHCFAEKIDATDLRDKAKQYALENFSSVIEHDDFIALPSSKLVELISSDDLIVESEEWVFHGVLKWLHARDQRETELAQVLEHVRFPLMETPFLYDVVEPLFHEYPDCQYLVSEAQRYHLLPERRWEMDGERTKKRNRALEEVILVVESFSQEVRTYNPVTAEWKNFTLLPITPQFLSWGCYCSITVTESNIIYLSNKSWICRYNWVTSRWEEIKSPQIRRKNPGLGSVGDFVYAVGGRDEKNKTIDTVERFNPHSNAWELVASMDEAVSERHVFTFAGRLYVVGTVQLSFAHYVLVIQEYDPDRNSWLVLTKKDHIFDFTACMLDERIYIMFGNRLSPGMDYYDVRKEVWIHSTPLHEKRKAPGVAVVGGKMYVIGGSAGVFSSHKSMECFDRTTNAWTICAKEMQLPNQFIKCVRIQI